MPFMTISEFAERTDRSAGEVRKLVCDEGLPVHTLEGSGFVIDQDEGDEWIASYDAEVEDEDTDEDLEGDDSDDD